MLQNNFLNTIKNKLSNFKFFIFDVLMLYLSNDLPIFAGASAFFMIISSIPLFMIMFSTISLIPSIDVEDFVNTINLLFPDIPYIKQVVDYIVSIARELSKSNVLYINIITSLITGSTCLFSFIVGIRKVHKIKHTSNYILIKIMTIINIFILYFTIILTMLFFILGRLLLNFLNIYLPFAAQILSNILEYKYLAIGVALILLTSSLYTCCSNFKRKYSDNLIGSLFATFTWLIISNIFSYYFANFAKYQHVYGSLTGIILTLLWLFICINLVFIGSCINEAIIPTSQILPH